MHISPQAAFNAASDQCATLVALSTNLPALAEAMVTSGLALLVRERGAIDAAAFTMSLLHLALRDEAARGD